jgi:hypothetical protein
LGEAEAANLDIPADTTMVNATDPGISLAKMHLTMISATLGEQSI